MRETIIQLKDITFAYPGNPPVLEDINLDINMGDFVIVLGPNGSAKTTLLKIILGLLKPQKGTVHIGTTQGSIPKIGYLPQKTTFFNRSFPATVREILEITNKKNRQQINAILEKVELKEKKHTLLGNLSGGQLQRVFLARTLLNNPQIIILDEPTNNLDQLAQKELCRLLVNLHKEGLTILMVTHDLATIQEYASRFLYVAQKKVTEIAKENWGVIRNAKE